MTATNITKRVGSKPKRRRNASKRTAAEHLARLDLSTLPTTTLRRTSPANALPVFPDLTTTQTPPSTKFFPPQTIHLATHHLPSSRTPLQNPIHPLFRPSNFPTLPPHHHRLLAPALTLASRFLTSPATLPWWLPTLLSRPPVPHPTVRAATVLAPVPDTPPARAAAAAALRARAEDVTRKRRRKREERKISDSNSSSR
ncbi:MAG: hypothetical protein LQ345_004898 [Seirophora villosa]|nr:MAG: hypothetical protein LQ345_004898 [Seirophora villosa]